MYKIGFTSTFKKQYRHYESVDKIRFRFLQVMDFLIQEKPLPTGYRNHTLSGNLKGYSEFHILPDVLIVYEIDSIEKKITFSQMGSHSDLFK